MTVSMILLMSEAAICLGSFSLISVLQNFRMESCFAIAPFVLLSVSILDWLTNIYPTRPRKQRIKEKFVKPVKTAIGIKSVLGYGQQQGSHATENSGKVRELV